MNIYTKSPKQYLSYLDRMHNRFLKSKNISNIFAYGSISRGQYKRTSDVDVRIIPKKGRWLVSLFILMRERTIAFFHLFPLDIYVVEIPELSKMRSDELPINFGGSAPVSVYDKVVEYESFRSNFIKNNIE